MVNHGDHGASHSFRGDPAPERYRSNASRSDVRHSDGRDRHPGNHGSDYRSERSAYPESYRSDARSDSHRDGRSDHRPIGSLSERADSSRNDSHRDSYRPPSYRDSYNNDSMCGAKATALAIKQMAIEMAGARSGMTSGMAGARGQITAVRSSAEVLTTTGSMPTGVPLTVIVVLRPRPMDRLRTEEP